MSVITKICGLRTPEAVDAALAGGADFIGLVFFAKSPRNVSLADAAALANRARGRAGVVALSVDADDVLLRSIVEQVAPDVLQLHGHESPVRAGEVKERYRTLVWKAVPVETAGDAEAAFTYAGVADRILFDAKAPKGADLPGGNGRAFDWHVLDGVKGRLGFILSGGLTPDNVAEAIRVTGAEGVDVSSGVESAPGFKDPALIDRFLRAAKGST